MAMLVTVYYEDQSASGTKSYGPHELLRSCVAQILQRERYGDWRKQLVPNPCKGNAKLIEKESRDRANLPGPVIVVLDEDKIRENLGLTEGCCKQEIKKKLEEKMPGVLVVLLVRNCESLVEACCEVLGEPTPEKGLVNRERILGAAAGRQDLIPGIMASMVSFQYLARKTAALVLQIEGGHG